MASYDPSSTNSSSYFNVPNIQSRLVPFKQLRERTHRKSEETPPLSALQQQETTQPIPVPRRKCPGSSDYISRSPVPGRTEPENQTQQRPRPSSFHGEDSLKIIELRYQESSEPQPTNEQKPVPKPRTKIPGRGSISITQVPEMQFKHKISQESPDDGRKRVYSKGSKEYKLEHKKNQEQSKTKANGHYISPFPVHGTGMSPCGSDPPSLIPILDLATDNFMSIRHRYVGNDEEDIKEKTLDINEISTRDLLGERESTLETPDFEIPGLSFKETQDGLHHITSSTEKRTPPDKPPRKKSAPITETPPILYHYEQRQTSPELPRSSSSVSFQSSSTERSKSKGFFDVIRCSPIFGRKNKTPPTITDTPTTDITVDIRPRMDDEESVISQTGISKSKLPPLHRATLNQLCNILKDKTIDPNIRDDEGYTALHWYVQKPRRARHKLLLMCLQSGCGFDIDAQDNFDNTPLHIAAEKNDYLYGKILVAFGADILVKNYQELTPRDLAKQGQLLELLSQFPEPLVNEFLSLASLPQELESLNVDELKNEIIGRLMVPERMSGLVRLMDTEIQHQKEKLHVSPEDEFFSMTQRSLEQISEDIAMNGQCSYIKNWKKTAGNRVLFLDGGGIRGLVQIEVLMELEHRTGRRITELFDWIIGTSTGGIVVLGLVYGNKTLTEMKQVYFQMKNEVFVGSGIAGTFLNMAQKSRNLEHILKREIGDTPLNIIHKPKIMICTVNKEQLPIKVQFFNNFMTDKPELTDIPAWKAARATSAAPMYFTPYQGKYVDGGVMANNPCEFAMKEINLYDQSMGIPERHFLLAMSVGTGIYPDKTLEGGEWGKGFNIKKQLQYVKEMVDMLTQAIGESETAAQNFAISCQKYRDPIPFFRFNPQLIEGVSPGEIDDWKIVELILQTKQYLASQDVQDKLDQLVQLFKRLVDQSTHQ